MIVAAIEDLICSLDGQLVGNLGDINQSVDFFGDLRDPRPHNQCP